MKKLTLFFLLAFFSLIINGQDKFPSFGKIDKADLELKDCSFDLGAEAMVLIDVGEIQYYYLQNIGWMSEATYRVRIKVLKASAIHRAEIILHYYSKNRVQEISNVKGVSFNLDAAGNITETEMEKKAVYDKPIDKEHSEVSFALPDVKTGTVFEYKYKITSKSYSYLPTWNFQQSIPVRYSAYNIVLPSYFQFTVQVIKRQEMEKIEGRSAEDGTWYIMHNVPALKEEPFSSGTKDYLQRVEFQLSKIETSFYSESIRTTWPKLINELLENEDFGLAIKKNIKRTGDLDMQLSAAKSTAEKVRLVYNYVQSNMQWNNQYGIYSDNGIKEAWDKNNGSISEINFILIRLLRDAGIDADPLLASTKDNGTINVIYPFLNQFNCVLAYVKDDNDTYIMNAADKFNPYNIVPYDVSYTNALLVNKKEGGLIAIRSSNMYSSTIFFTCGVEVNGMLSGDATLGSSEYARNVRMNTYKKDKLKSLLQDNDGIIIKIDSISVNNEKDELKPLEQKIKFSGNIQSSGEYSFLPYNLFTGIGKNPFIEENRVMDIDFSYPRSYVISGSYIVADNYNVSELPKNTKMILPDTSIVLTRMSQIDGNIVSLRLTLDFKAQGYTAESYPYIKEFYKKMYEILDERIVLKKK